MSSALILTLKLEQAAFEIFNDLRQKHFPPARNFLNAHVTLFHALPGERETEIKDVLRDSASATKPLPLTFGKPIFLGKGVAIEIVCPPLVELRQRLSNEFADYLTAQDRQKLRPHITIQNKVEPEIAKKLFAETSATWQTFDSFGAGLQLWQYLNGPWRLIEEFQFGNAND